MRTFSDLGLDEALAGGLSSLGFAGPTPVQELSIPALREGRDLLMESETGTGKTFAYLAPAIDLLARAKGGEPLPAAAEPEAAVPEAAEAGETGTPSDAPRPPRPPRKAPKREGPILLVASPTQELAVQIGREAERLAAAAGLEIGVAVFLGGSPMDRQEARLRSRPEIVVGTLGRLADLVALRRLPTRDLRYLVLDEADRLLVPETEDLALALLQASPRSCARILASATLPERTRRKAAPFLREPLVAEAKTRPVLAGDIEHWCFYCDGRKRLDFLRRLESAIAPSRCLVFMTNAARIPEAVERLAAWGLPVDGIHAKVEKEARRVALERLTEGKIRYLVTSDLGARGLDIPGLSHVVSLDLPEEPEVYVHRAGRTGRAGAKGVSIVLADGVELRRASRHAVREGFVYRCKILERGLVLEPPAEEFFARVEEAESERRDYKARRSAAPADARRGSEPREPRGGVRGGGAPGLRGPADGAAPRRDDHAMRRDDRPSRRDSSAPRREGPPRRGPGDREPKPRP